MTGGLFPWKPHAKQRPVSVTLPNGAKSTFTPKPTRDAEKALGAQWTDEPLAGPLAVDIILHGDSVAVNVEMAEKPATRLRGDIDNYAKTVLDALNKKAWADDSQIVSLTVRFA